MLSKEKISIIIPAKNEEFIIKELIDSCRQYASEIIVIDGHSKDKTYEISKNLGAIVYKDNKLGKGDAIRLSITKATRDILVFIDADGSHDPHDIPKLIMPILNDEADHVSGSRSKGGSDELHGEFFSIIRLIGSAVITLFINLKLKIYLTDSQNGFRAIKRTVALELDLKENITTIEQEMVIKTVKKGFRIAEVPSHEYKRKNGVSHIKLRKVWFRYIYSCLKYLYF